MMQVPIRSSAVKAVSARPYYDPATPWRALRWRADGTPVRWDADRTIHWSFNTSGLVHEVVEMMEAAMKVLAVASGLDLVQAEMLTLTSEGWPPSVLSKDLPQVLITCVSSSDMPTHRTGIAGIAAPATRVDPDTGIAHYFAASIRLAVERVTFGVALHEGMHALGLAHVGDVRQQMFWRDTAQGVLGDGDEAGLRAIGAR
jgi:hypothetical protein